MDLWSTYSFLLILYFCTFHIFQVSRTQAFIDQAVDVEEKPFFLYFASTLTHSPDVYDALSEWTYTDSPKGTLTGDEVPDDTTMRTRTEIWDLATVAGTRKSKIIKTEYAEIYWVDEQFGAVISYLEEKGIYDETLIVLQSDHGQIAKGTKGTYYTSCFSVEIFKISQ